MNGSAFRRRELLLGSLAVAGLGLSRRAGARSPSFSIGYAAMPWGDPQIKTAIAEISEVGYPGIQVRLKGLEEFASPGELRAALAKARLTFVCLSGGSPGPDPAKRQQEIDDFMVGAKFARAAGALHVQATSPKRGDGKVDAATIKGLAATLDELGKRTAEIGLQLGFHNHMGQLGQEPADLDAILAATDPRHVKLLLDTGHYAAAGGDPVRAIHQHARRIGMMHIKDVADRPDNPGAKKYEFVEIGKGKVDFKGIFAALRAVDYRGWVVVELDSVPAGRAPKDAAAANKAFIGKTLGLPLHAV